MTVRELLQRSGDGRFGPASLINPRTRPVVTELMSAGKAFKANEERRRIEGLGPTFCPPAKSSMGMPELLAAFRALPPEGQQQPVRTALPAVLRARYPCR